MEFLIQPWAHQLEGMKRAMALAKEAEETGETRLKNYGFFFEMGAGKTPTTINTIRAIWNEKKRLPRTLIFGPPIVIENWIAEWMKHSRIPRENLTALYGPGKKRAELIREIGWRKNEFGEPLPVPHIFVTNYQSLLMEGLSGFFSLWEPEVVVFDEIQKLKDYKSKTSKLAERLVNGRMKLVGPKYAQVMQGPRPFVYGLSGSPVLNTSMDIFHIYKVLDAGLTFGNNFFAFRNTFFMDKNAGMNRQNYFPNWVPRPGALEELAKKMQRNAMRVLKKDCMDLPPLVRETIKVPMSVNQKKLYKQMLEDYVAFFERDGKEHVASATLAITKGLRLMQLASGFVKTVEDNELPVEEGWNAKQDALHELLEELTPAHKVIVWAVWKNNYEQIREVLRKLGVEWVEVHGEIAGKDKYAAVDRFNTDPTCRVLLGHPGSGGIGINLVSASYSIFYSRNFSLEQDIQAEARNYRGGSERHEKVTRIDLVTQDSIEEKIVEKLASKSEIGEKILREITLELKR